MTLTALTLARRSLWLWSAFALIALLRDGA